MSETESKRTPVETVENAILYSDGTILVKNVRLSYPHVLLAKENKNDDGTVTKGFSCTGLLPKTTHDEAKKLIAKAIARMLKESNKGEKIPANKKFLRDGDPKDEDDVGKPEEAGMWVLSARESKRPRVLSNKRDPATGKARRLSPDVQADLDKIYGGCWGNMLIRPWFQNNKYGKRVNAGLSVVQFKKDDEPFGSGRIGEDDVDETFDGELEDGDEDGVDADDEGEL